MGPGDLEIRTATAADQAAIIELAGTALGWDPAEPNAALFGWKHLENPFGPSVMLVAEADQQLVGFRAFLRWELAGSGGRCHRVVRAVDTATHHGFQRRGIFSRLTVAGLELLAAEGVSFVFNTPNDQSRPGYLKLGWCDVGRLPVAVRPSRVGSALPMLRARTPAAKWSVPVSAGQPATEALASPGLGGLLDRLPGPTGLATPRTVAYLRWRYRFGPLHYRVAMVGADPGDGLVVFRVRRRGAATEATIADILLPSGGERRLGPVLRRIGRETGADYMISVGSPTRWAGLVPIPGQGPRLTARSVTTTPPRGLAGWSLAMGDIELF